MTVFDLVLYNSEDDVLECRLWELADVVDVMVVLEGDRTFTGKPKMKAPRTRFKQWDHLIHWVDYVTPMRDTAWAVEAETRNELLVVADSLGCKPDDVVTVCDVDEIWSPGMEVQFAQGPHSVLMRHLAMSVHWEYPMELTCVGGPRRSVETAQGFRSNRNGFLMLVGGWHVAWMGGPEWCANKIRSFSHQELNTGDVDSWMRICHEKGHFVRGEPANEVEVTDDWPRWIREDRHPETWRARR